MLEQALLVQHWSNVGPTLEGAPLIQRGSNEQDDVDPTLGGNVDPTQTSVLVQRWSNVAMFTG